MARNRARSQTRRSSTSIRVFPADYTFAVHHCCSSVNFTVSFQATKLADNLRGFLTNARSDPHLYVHCTDNWPQGPGGFSNILGIRRRMTFLFISRRSDPAKCPPLLGQASGQGRLYSLFRCVDTGKLQVISCARRSDSSGRSIDFRKFFSRTGYQIHVSLGHPKINSPTTPVGTLPRNQLSLTKFSLQNQSIILRHYQSCRGKI